MSLSWSVSMVFSASVTDPRTLRRLRVLGPGVLALGLTVAGLTQWNNAGVATVALWFAALIVAGVGIGIAFPHLTVATMGVSADPAEAGKASAGANTVELIALSFSSALGGVLMNLGAPSAARSAQYLLLGFAVIATLGCLAARNVNREPAMQPPATEPERRAMADVYEPGNQGFRPSTARVVWSRHSVPRHAQLMSPGVIPYGRLSCLVLTSC